MSGIGIHSTNNGDVERAFESWLHNAGMSWGLGETGPPSPIQRTITNLLGSLRVIADNRKEKSGAPRGRLGKL